MFGGVGIYRSTNGGTSWTSLAPSGGTHSDQHAIAFDPASAHSFYLGNDGGLYRFATGAQTWTALNASLSVAQAQSVGPHPTNSSVMLAGFQDNGTARFDATKPPASSWSQVDNLDGGFALFDTVNPLFAYHTFATTTVGPWVSRSTDGGVTFNSASSSAALQTAMATAGDEGAAYFPPIASDPTVAEHVLFGAHSVYVSNDAMATWAVQTTQDLTGGCNSGACGLQDLEIAASDHTKAYALSMETSTTFRPTPFKIFTTDQANIQVNPGQPEGAHWTDKTAQLPPIVFPDSTQATGIAIDPFNYNVAYLSLSGFTSATGIGHVFVTTDFGGSWTQADGNPNLLSPPPANALPDVPVLRLLVDRNDPTANTVLAATDIGIFKTTDGGTTWAPFNLGHDSRGRGFRYRAEPERRGLRRDPWARDIPTGRRGIRHHTDHNSNFDRFAHIHTNRVNHADCDAHRNPNAHRDADANGVRHSDGDTHGDSHHNCHLDADRDVPRRLQRLPPPPQRHRRQQPQRARRP